MFLLEQFEIFKKLAFNTVFHKINWYFSRFIYSYTGVVDWTLTPEVKGEAGGLFCTYFLVKTCEMWSLKINYAVPVTSSSTSARSFYQRHSVALLVARRWKRCRLNSSEFFPYSSLWFRKLNFLQVNVNKLEVQKQRFANHRSVALIYYFDPIFLSCESLQAGILKCLKNKCCKICRLCSECYYWRIVTMPAQRSMISFCYFSSQLFKTIRKVLNIIMRRTQKGKAHSVLARYSCIVLAKNKYSSKERFYVKKNPNNKQPNNPEVIIFELCILILICT